MKPGLIYRGEWVNTETDVDNVNIQQECRIDIIDQETLIDDAADEEIIDLEMAGDPCRVVVIDNSEDPFTPIRSKQLEAQIFSGNGISNRTFASGGDKRFKVVYTVNSITKFTGFLSVGDISMQFLPDPNIISLTATDGLGYLNDPPLTNFEGLNPRGENQIIDYLAWALKETGLALNIVVCFNIREAFTVPLSQDGQSPLSAMAIFFEAGSGNKIRVPFTDWFYVGQVFTVVGGSGNTGPFTVTSIVPIGLDVDVFVTEPISVFATVVPATFTDTAAEGDGHFFKHEWLHAKTFEDDIGTCINGYDALSDILLKEEATIYQDGDTWFIMRKDEYETRLYYLYTFDWEGNFVSSSTAQFEKSIGVDLPLSWMNDDAEVNTERPLKSVKEIFTFETPQELPDNSDYTRGEETTRVTEAGYTAYNLDDWAIGNLWGSAATLPTIDAIILRSFNFLGDEETRFIMFTQPAGATGAFEYIRSSAIPVGFLDKFNFSFDVSAMTNPAGDGTLQVCFIVLYATDGTVYILNPANTSTTWLNTDPTPPLTWHLTNAQLSLFRTGLNWAIFTDDVKTEWSSCSIDAAPVPKEGDLRIFLFAANQSGSAFDNFKIRYQNIQFEYRAYIGGTYRKYKGQYHKVETTANYVGKREEETGISDSPKRLFKKALLKVSDTVVLHNGSVTFGAPNSINVSGYKVLDYDPGMKVILTGTNAGVFNVISVFYHIIGNTTELIVREAITTVTETATISKYLFTLANRFYNAQVFPDKDYPDDTYLHPYGHLQVFDVWNQFNRIMSKFEGTVDRLDSSGDIPDLKWKYYLTDADENTTNKMFMLLHCDQDHHLCEWNAFLHEVFDLTIPKDYSGHSFKYITNDE